jgi:integrase
MASIFKSPGKSKYTILYFDENGKRRKRAGFTDKGETRRLANKLEEDARKRREGLIDDTAIAYRDHGRRSLAEHLDDWKKTLQSRCGTAQHVKLHVSRAMRIVALIKGAKLSDIQAPRPVTREGVKQAGNELRSRAGAARIADLTPESVQSALARLIEEGRSHQTANHHRNAIKSFCKWLHETRRVRDYPIRGVSGFNIKEDPRHERRTIALDELQRLIDAAQAGEQYKSMTGPMRALCYRLAVASGLRYSEIASIVPESFDWQGGTITIRAAYAKNGQTVTLPIARDLSSDLAIYTEQLHAGKPIFPLPHDKGAAMLRVDLKRAGIPYRDAGGLVFDFHSLRCELATLADAAGVSPRVVQKLMRHSKLEMTGRYTRPRAVDLEIAAMMVPSLRPTGKQPEALEATGTDPVPVLLSATQTATCDNDNRRNSLTGEGLEPSTNGLTYLIGFHRPSRLRLRNAFSACTRSLALMVWTIPSPSQACRV